MKSRGQIITHAAASEAHLHGAPACPSSVENSLKTLPITGNGTFHSPCLYKGFFDFLCETLGDENRWLHSLKATRSRLALCSALKTLIPALHPSHRVSLQPHRGSASCHVLCSEFKSLMGAVTEWGVRGN